MIKQILLLIMPTVFIYIGLSVFQNILITFILFYGWLLFIPLFITFWKKPNRPSLQLYLTKKNMLVGIISGLICLVSIFGFVVIFQSSIIDIDQLRQQLEKWDFSGAKVILLVLVLIWNQSYFGGVLLARVHVWTTFSKSRKYARCYDYVYILYVYHLIVVMEIFSFPFNVLAVIPVFLAGVMWGIFRSKIKFDCCTHY